MATNKKAAPKKAAPAKKTSKQVIAPKKAAPKKAAAKKPAAKPAIKKPAPKPAVKTTPKALPKKAAAAPAKKAAPKKVEKIVKKPTVKTVKVEKPVKIVKKEVKTTVSKTAVAVKAKAETAKPSKLVMPKISTKTSIKYQPDFTKSVLDTPKMEKAKSVVTYSDADLQEFKDIILRKLDAAKKELTYLQGLITRRDEGSDMDEGRYMTMEDGSVSMEREQLSQLASRQITFIDHLEKALVRVENKTYGICRVTGKLIDKARLRAVPHATLSMEAKSGMSR